MRFIYHYNGIFTEPRVKFEFLQQDTVGHNLYLGIRRGMIFKPHLVPDQLAERHP